MSEYIITDEQIAENRRLHGRKLLVMPVIVRCRDCKHYQPDPSPIDPGWPMWCDDTGRDMIHPDGFCAWGERKENDNGLF